MEIKRTKQEQGKLARKRGQTFENDVRHHYEDMGWTVCKWQNTIKEDKIIHAPHRYMPFKRMIIMGSGFPDFVCFRKIEDNKWEIIGLESKKNKYLDKAEKDMCNWYHKNKIFDRIEVAYKKKGNVEIYEVQPENVQDQQT